MTLKTVDELLFNTETGTIKTQDELLDELFADTPEDERLPAIKLAILKTQRAEAYGTSLPRQLF